MILTELSCLVHLNDIKVLSEQRTIPMYYAACTTNDIVNSDSEQSASGSVSCREMRFDSYLLC
jgi:hypothetical protein